MENLDRPIHFSEAKYLKHMGEIKDIKVSIHVVRNHPYIYIGDYEFKTFHGALAYLQYISTQVVDIAPC